MNRIHLRIFAGTAIAGAIAILGLALRSSAPIAADAVDAATFDAPLLDAAIDADADSESDAEPDADAAEDDVAVAVATTATWVDDTPLCKEFARKEWERIDREIARAFDGGKPVEDHMSSGPALERVTCHATPHGAWATTIAPGTRYASRSSDDGAQTWDVEGRWQLVHLSTSGRRVVLEDGFTYSQPWYGVQYGGSASIVDDFDSDGEPEVFVDNYAAPPEGEGSDSHMLYTFKNGAITRYALPPDTFELKDIDGDGRKDALFSLGTLTGYETCLGGSDVTLFTWAAHAKPNGEFDATDAVAKKYAADQCASAPRRVRVPTSSFDIHEAVSSILCARMRGRSAASIHAEIAKQCDSYEFSISACQAPQPRICFEWLKTLPDFAFPGPATDWPDDGASSDAGALDSSRD